MECRWCPSTKLTGNPIQLGKHLQGEKHTQMLLAAPDRIREAHTKLQVNLLEFQAKLNDLHQNFDDKSVPPPPPPVEVNPVIRSRQLMSHCLLPLSL